MTDKNKYKTKAARKPLHFWMQPVLLFLLVCLLWHLLPLSALMYTSREIPALPSPHVAYVNLDPVFASEALRMSMQALRRTAFDDGNAITFEAVEPFETLGPPELLQQGTIYPGKWVPGDVTPLALTLPDLLCVSKPVNRYGESDAPQEGVHISVDPGLEKAGFKVPDIKLKQLPGSGSLRFFVETGEDGSVVHVLLVNPGGKSAIPIEHLLYRGRSEKAASGEIRIMWRNS